MFTYNNDANSVLPVSVYSFVFFVQGWPKNLTVFERW